MFKKGEKFYGLTVVGALEQFKEALKDLPSTNWKTFTGTFVSAIAVLCGLFVFVYLAIKKQEADHFIFGEILLFCGAWFGIAYRQFAKKRDTFIPDGRTREDMDHQQ